MNYNLFQSEAARVKLPPRKQAGKAYQRQNVLRAQRKLSAVKKSFTVLQK